MKEIQERINRTVITEQTPMKRDKEGNERPMVCETVILEQLNYYADVGRSGPDRYVWTMKPNFKLPTKEELEELLKDALFDLE
jgi:hypothetical protein